MEILFLIFGIIGGILGGMGMGGGTLLIPLLTLGLSVGQKSAQLINLITFIPMSVLALILHVKNGYVVKSRIAWVIIPATLSAILGAYLASAVNVEILKKAFGGFLISLGIIYFLMQIFSQKRKRKC